MNEFIRVFKKLLIFLLSLYIVLCTACIILITFSLGGKFTIILVFFLAIPAGIFEIIGDVLSIQMTIFRSMNSLSSMIAMYIYNTVFAVFLSVLLSFVFLLYRYIDSKLRALLSNEDKEYRGRG
jgi:hypothetical protein